MQLDLAEQLREHVVIDERQLAQAQGAQAVQAGELQQIVAFVLPVARDVERRQRRRQLCQQRARRPVQASDVERAQLGHPRNRFGDRVGQLEAAIEHQRVQRRGALRECDDHLVGDADAILHGAIAVDLAIDHFHRLAAEPAHAVAEVEVLQFRQRRQVQRVGR